MSSLTSSKCQEPPMQQILAQTIHKYYPLPSKSSSIGKGLSPLSSKVKTSHHFLLAKNEGLIKKYENLLKNLRQYRKIVEEHLKGEGEKVNNFYQELIKTIERNQVRSQNWISSQLKTVNSMFDDQTLKIQQKLIELSTNILHVNLSQELSYYEQIKQFQVPIFTFKYVDVKALETLFHTYMVSDPTQLSSFGAELQMGKDKENRTQNLQQSKVIHSKSQKKHPSRDLLCDEDIIWFSRTENRQKYVEPSDIIIEQSESQEDSLISTSDFI